MSAEIIPFPTPQLVAEHGDVAVVCVDQLNDLWEFLVVGVINPKGDITAFYRAAGSRDHLVLADAVDAGPDKYLIRRGALAEIAVSALRGRLFHGIEAARRAAEPFRVR